MSHRHRLVTAGDMLVTGHGEIVLEEVLPHDFSFHAKVEFAPEEAPDPCVGPCHGDELEWEVDVRPRIGHGRCRRAELATSCERFKLRIAWNVGKARTINWKVTSR